MKTIKTCWVILGLYLFGTVLAQEQTVSPARICSDGGVIFETGRAECSEIDSLERLISDFETRNLNDNPYDAGQRGDRAALRLLPDVSYEADKRRRDETSIFLSRHTALSGLSMTGQEMLNYQLLGFVLRQDQRRQPFDEARLPFTNDSGFFNELSYISRQTRFESVDDYEAYAARLSELPRYFGQHKANLRRGIKTDYTASNEILPSIVSIIMGLSETETKSHPFFAPFNTYPDTISTCLLYTSPSPRDKRQSRMPSSA